MSLYIRQENDWRKVAKVFTKQSGVWMPVKSIMTRHNGYWKEVFKSEVVVTITASAQNLNVETLFQDKDWDGDVRKRVVIAPDVILGSTDPFTAALIIPDGWMKTLIIENYGFLYGAPGGPNGGPGGDAISSVKPGVILRNFNQIRSGGGGGGKGGKGGSGGQGSYNYTARQPASGYYQQDAYKVHSDSRWGFWNWYWGGTSISTSSNSTISTGGYTYYRGPQYYESQYEYRSGSDGDTKTAYRRDYGIYRTYTATAYTTGGVGGDGGAGGRGQGFNLARLDGSAGIGGTAGGTNAGNGGTGGKGGMGGDWGANGAGGATGNSGASGNSGAGTAGLVGSAGGLAGYAYNSALIDLEINTGVISGRV